MSVKNPIPETVVINTRPKHQAAGLSELLKKAGFEPYEFPLIEMALVEDVKQIVDALKSVSSGDWLVFSSANGAKFVSQLIHDQCIQFGPCHIAAIGEATAAILTNKGLAPEFIAGCSNSEGFANELVANFAPARAVLLRGELASRELPNILLSNKWIVDDISVYHSRLPLYSNEELQQLKSLLEVNKASCILCFTSSEAVRNLCKLISAVYREYPVLVVGPVTEKTARDCGFKKVLVAPKPNIDAMVDALKSTFNAQKKEM